LADLGLEPAATAERDGVHSWDLTLDGRKRHGVRMTLILESSVGLVCWVHYAPPLADSLRRVYGQMLHWNDELPFVKFALGADDRPVLSDEVPMADLSRDAVGLTIARLLATCDLLYPESAKWVDRIAKPEAGGTDAGVRLLERFATQLGELLA
jgi:Putative bacterial sensory transduction regulator